MSDPDRADDGAVTDLAPDDPQDGAPIDAAAPAPSIRSAGSRVRRTWASATTRQRAVGATVAIVSTALVAGLFAWGGGPTQDATAAASAGAASPSPARSGGPTPTASPTSELAYTRLAGSSAVPAATLTARGAVGAIVPVDTGFRLESGDGTPASTLATRLTVEPAFAFSVSKETGDRAALLVPSEPLAAGSVYRFALRGAGGEILDTWAFQAKQPLRIVGTLPETRSAEVPLDTGIEVTFDQDGVTGAEGHVSIEPATAGRFEQHGRTLSFIPTMPLSPAKVYSVTVRKGIAVAATGEATIVDTRFQFETAAAAGTSTRWTWQFPDEVVESATAERPTIGIWSYSDGEAKAPSTTRIAVYRLAGLDAAIGAFRTLSARPDWTRWSSAGLVDVTGLPRILDASLPLNAYRNAFWFRLPDRLAAGWYLVQQADGTKPTQTVLQVTDVAGYLAVSGTRTLVWANDLKGGKPLAGATISSEGTRLGSTDSRGLALTVTPKGLIPSTGTSCDRPCGPVVTVRTADGRQVFLPVSTGNDKLDGYSGIFWWSDADAQTWSILHTDRNRYRSGDTLNLWGYARDRATGAAPGSVTLRLDASSYDGSADVPTGTSLVRELDPSGAFHGSLPLIGLPDGSYSLSMSIGSRVIRSTGITIGPIAKPAYQLDLATGHHVYIVGDRVKVTVGARFFEGTAVPGVALRFGGFASGSATTDPLGVAVWRTVARIPRGEDADGPVWSTIEAMPARPEEAEITAVSRQVVIFPSSRTIDASGRIAGGKVIASGSVHLVAVDRLEAAMDNGRSWTDADVRGAKVRGATVTVRFTELVPKRQQVGTEYDFIEKKVVPIFVTDVIEVASGTVRVTTAADGSWTASVPASAADHTYAIQVSVGDPDGHTARVSTSASRGILDPHAGETGFPSLDPVGPVDPATELRYGIGDAVDVRMTDHGLAQTSGDGSRYLFFTAQNGIRGAVVQASRRYRLPFPAWGPPNLSIGAVRFTGSGYVGTAWYGAQFRAADRQLTVDVTTNAARYTPGQTVTVDVRTRTAGGAPIAATVILRAIDEKLFAIAAASDEDPLGELYLDIGNGVIDTYQTHRMPTGQSEGGDTTGGGERDDFRDSLLFTAITTGSDGRGRTTFRLSDDLTSWRVTASAVTRDLKAGVGSALVPVGLPFFIDASIAPEYLTADHPTIAVRTYGSAVATGSAVSVRVTSTTLGFDSGLLHGQAFATLDVPLPALRAGIQTLTISATTGSGSSARTDRLTRSFRVVATRLTRERTSYVELPSSASIAGGDGFTTVVVSDASGGRYLPLLSDLAAGTGARLDRALAADLASALLKTRFGVDTGPADAFAADRYLGLDDGLGVVPYGSSDLEVSALAAIVAPDKVDHGRLRFYLRGIRDDPESTRERRMVALAGLAGLGEPVLSAVVAATADPDLTVRERLMLGLAAARLGDAGTARGVLDALVAAGGEEAGTLARLRFGTSIDDVSEATALAAALAAAVGSPLAPRFEAYVEANPEAARIEVLPAIAFVTWSLDRLPVERARVAWTVDGTRHEVDLGAGASVRLDLTPAQLATLTLERLAGTVGVTSSWRETVAPAAFSPDPDLTIARSVTPLTSVSAADLVTVELKVRFATQAAAGCRQVVDLVPSGLTPVGGGSQWVDPDQGDPVSDDGVVLPYDQTASRVSFCVAPTTTRREFTLRYVARVITPGTYAWEPAVAQSSTSESIANLTAASTITIH